MPMRLGEKEAREAYEHYKELDPGFDNPNDIVLKALKNSPAGLGRASDPAGRKRSRFLKRLWGGNFSED